MKRVFVLLPLLCCAAVSRAQVVLPFEVQAAHGRLAADDGLDALLATLTPGGERKAQLAALAAIEQRAASLDFAGQYRVVAALNEASASTFIAPEVRARALMTLGKTAASFGDWTARREAVQALLEAATVDNPSDSRWESRLYAWLGLASVAGRLPPADDAIAQSVVTAVLDEERNDSRGPEKTAAMRVLHNLLLGEGPAAIYRSASLTQRVEDELLRPVENGGMDRLYSDSDRGPEYRYCLLRSLYMLSWAQPDVHNIRQRLAQVCEDVSRGDPSEELRYLARTYAEVLRRYR